MSALTSLFDEKASRIVEQVDDIGRETAGGLHAAASSIRKGGRQSSKAIEDLAESTANTLDGAGSFVRKHNLKQTIGESRKLVRRYLARTPTAGPLLLAAGVGLLTGFAIRRLTHSCGKSVALGTVDGVDQGAVRR